MVLAHDVLSIQDARWQELAPAVVPAKLRSGYSGGKKASSILGWPSGTPVLSHVWN